MKINRSVYFRCALIILVFIPLISTAEDFDQILLEEISESFEGQEEPLKLMFPRFPLPFNPFARRPRPVPPAPEWVPVSEPEAELVNGHLMLCHIEELNDGSGSVRLVCVFPNS